MAKKTVTITMTAEMVIIYDPDSKEFKDTLESFREVINSEGDENDVIIQAVHGLRMSSHESMIEGIGYVKREGRYLNENAKKQFSGITVVDDDPQFEYEIQ